MNKLFLGLAIVAGSLVFAQETKKVTVTPINKEKEPVRFGIKGGANAASFSEQELSTKNQKIGFHAGAFVNIPLSEKFSIQPEVLYNQMGAKSIDAYDEYTQGDTTVKTKNEYTVDLNYISVPLMLQMKPAHNFYIEAGPEFSYFLNGKTKSSTVITTTKAGNTSTTTESGSQSINKDDINRFNFGLGLGLGYYFTKDLGISARYINGLGDTRKENPELTNQLSNRVFQLGLNYKF